MNKDHVPPLVFFPEQRDIGYDLRANLITVPSCEVHNNRRSGDDEWAAYTVVAAMQANRIAQNQFFTKVMRALNGNRTIGNIYYPSLGALKVGPYSVPSFSINRRSALSNKLPELNCPFDLTMEKIARGLYFKITGRKLEHDSILRVDSPDLMSRVKPVWVIRQHARLVRRLERYLWSTVRVGPPEVFQFSYWLHPVYPHQFAFRFTFYEGFRVWVYTNSIISP